MRSMNVTADDIARYEHHGIRIICGDQTIDSNDIIPGSFSYKAGSSAGAIVPGGCVTASFSVSIDNHEGNYGFNVDDEITVYVTYGSIQDELVSGAIASKTESSGVFTLQCYDLLRKADKVKWTSYSFPMTAAEIISSACGDAGIPYEIDQWANSITVDLSTTEEDGTVTQPELNMTCRQAISQALAISGLFGYMRGGKKLICRWYEFSGDLYFDDYFSCTVNEEYTSYTGVQVTGGEVSGTEDRLYVLSSNTFVTDDNRDAITERLTEAMVEKDFASGSVGILADPRIEPGDCIYIRVKSAGTEKTLMLPVCQLTFKDSMIETLSCTADTSDALNDKRASTTETIENALTITDYPRIIQDVTKAVEGGGGSGGGSEESDRICQGTTGSIQLRVNSSVFNSLRIIGEDSVKTAIGSGGGSTITVGPMRGTDDFIPQAYATVTGISKSGSAVTITPTLKAGWVLTPYITNKTADSFDVKCGFIDSAYTGAYDMVTIKIYWQAIRTPVQGKDGSNRFIFPLHK